MPNLPISQLPAATSLQSDAQAAIVQDEGGGETTYRISASDFSQNATSIDVATNYTSAGERYIFVTDVTTGPVPRTVTLSTADFNARRVITIADKTNTASINPIVIVTQGVEPINGISQRIDIRTDAGSITFVADGSTWQMLGNVSALNGDNFERATNDIVPVEHQNYKARIDGAGTLQPVANGDAIYSERAYGFDGTNYVELFRTLLNVNGAVAAGQIPNDIFIQKANASGALENIMEFTGNNVIIYRRAQCLNEGVINASGPTNQLNLVWADVTGGAINITLSQNEPGYFVDIIDISGMATSNNITLTPSIGTINGQATATISANYGAARVRFDGSNFYLA